MKTLDEIKPIKDERADSILNLPGVTGMGLGYKVVDGVPTSELSIRVYVEAKRTLGDIPEAERIPKTIKGVKTDVIERKWVLNPMLMAVADMQLMSDTGNYDPLQGGISIGPCRSIYLDAATAACHGAPAAGWYTFVGTLGAIVVDNTTNAEMLLSNFHVMCVDSAWQVGDTMAQPGRPDGGVCPAHVVGALQRAALTATVDAAVASHTARGWRSAIVDIGTVMGTNTATLGMAVRKRGRTTGLTYGTVDDIDLSVNLNYCDGIGAKTLVHQIGIAVDASQSAKFGGSGDSGSVVVDGSGKIVGLYYAGDSSGASGVANPIQDVLTALNVHIPLPKKWDHEPIIKKQEHEPIVKKQDHEPIVKKQDHEPIVKKQDHEPIKGTHEPIKGTHEPIKGFEPPIGPEQPSAEVSGSLEERIRNIEAALAQVTHFIATQTRPEGDASPLMYEPGSDAP